MGTLIQFPIRGRYATNSLAAYPDNDMRPSAFGCCERCSARRTLYERRLCANCLDDERAHTARLTTLLS